MGYRLYREIRDYAPLDWTPTERLVALMIADDAGEETRKSWIKLPELMARTGVRTESGIRQALQRLAKRGYEFRVPIAKGKDGRSVFAVKGHSLDFIVPPMPDRRLSGVAYPKATVMDGKATVADAKGDCPESPLSSEPLPQISPHEVQKKAPRRAERSARGDNSDTQPIVDDVRRAAVHAYGDSAADLTDEQCMHIYRRFCCGKTGQPYTIAADPYAYLAGGPLKDVPTLAQALQPSAKRRIPMAALRCFNDPETPDGDLVGIVESVTGTLSPGEDPAVEKMIMDGRPLHYIVNAVFSGNLNLAA